MPNWGRATIGGSLTRRGNFWSRRKHVKTTRRTLLLLVAVAVVQMVEMHAVLRIWGKDRRRRRRHRPHPHPAPAPAARPARPRPASIATTPRWPAPSWSARQRHRRRPRRQHPQLPFGPSRRGPSRCRCRRHKCNGCHHIWQRHRHRSLCPASAAVPSAAAAVGFPMHSAACRWAVPGAGPWATLRLVLLGAASAADSAGSPVAAPHRPWIYRREEGPRRDGSASWDRPSPAHPRRRRGRACRCQRIILRGSACSCSSRTWCRASSPTILSRSRISAHPNPCRRHRGPVLLAKGRVIQ